MARFGVLKALFVTGIALGGLGSSGCLISFDHYAEGDACEAARDAGIRLRTAPDQVLRGCDAGVKVEPEPEPEPQPEPEASAGAAGAESSQ